MTSVADLAHWERTAIDGYPLPELQDAPPGAFAAPALLDDERFALLRRPRRRPACRRRRVVRRPTASPRSPTAPRCRPLRRRGFWRLLAVERLRATPEVWMTGVFSDLSRPGAEALGFVPLLRLTLWILDRP